MVLANEMDWIVAFFKTQEALWTNCIIGNSSDSVLNGSGDAMLEESMQRRPITQGHQCYALRDPAVQRHVLQVFDILVQGNAAIQ